jgi:hypothetical protein
MGAPASEKTDDDGGGQVAVIDRGRLYRTTTDYPVPMEKTFATLGHGSTGMTESIAETVACLRRHEPGYRR